MNDVAPVSIVPLHSEGFPGRPGLEGRRAGGRAWSPRFETRSHRLDVTNGVRHQSLHPRTTLVVESTDTEAQLDLRTTITVGDVLEVHLQLTNTASRRYSLDALTVTLPLASAAAELLGFEGRWAREFQPVRTEWTHGAVLSENRRGRTSHENPPLVFAGTPGFGEWSGEVWGAHVAWSGNHTLLAERLPDGRRYLQAGELLHPGEVVLEAGESYTTPNVVAVYSDGGLTPATWGFHRSLRSSPAHPTSPRPVLLNTWEAVYFDHDTDRLRELADVAAEIGVERFVLDDGWFGSRRSDRSGLGDWWVSPEVYPDGLTPLIDHVTGLGMEFGIWVEPEMVNPDSDLYRAHPEWALTTDGYDAVLGRNQLVLDLGNPDAFAHILAHLDALLGDHDIAYVKWDMNRDHVQGSGTTGSAGTRVQTLALYALLDELRRRHPRVEFESCASGGGRIDHEILQRTERVWTSDCNDALERQTIQRGASMLLPPEVMGAHIGPTRSHTTARVHTLAFRAATAMFGHLGVEWNVARLGEDDRSGAGRGHRPAPAVPPAAPLGRCRAIRHRDPVLRARRLRIGSLRGARVVRAAHHRAEPDPAGVPSAGARSRSALPCRARCAPGRALGHGRRPARLAHRRSRPHGSAARRPRHPTADHAPRIRRPHPPRSGAPPTRIESGGGGQRGVATPRKRTGRSFSSSP